MTTTSQGGAVLYSRFDSLVQQETSRIESGVALYDGRPIDGGAPLADLLPSGAASDEPERFELLCPPKCAAVGTAGARNCSSAEAEAAATADTANYCHLRCEAGH